MPTRSRPALLLSLAAAGVVLSTPAAVRAGGYDTPMLYSARHLGMGGTAIGYVDDASAPFHNPAGLAQIGRFNVIGDASLLLAHTQASVAFGATDLRSERTVAPLFLLGAGYRFNRFLTAGLGVYPIASAGASYKYAVGTSNVENRTRLVFLEASPTLALNLPGRVRLGAGYRVTYVSIERFQGDPAFPPAGLDFAMNGVNWLGLRAGAQWTALPWLQVGAVYRHKITTKVTNSEGIALGSTYSNIDTTFVLPSKAGVGARADVKWFGVAMDTEYVFNSQNGAYPLNGTPPVSEANPMPVRTAVPNVFAWRNEIVLRGGVEARLLPTPAQDRRRLALRLGYVYDGKTTNEHFPSAFGTPPGPSHVVTGGVGWNGGRWKVNAAYARRFGSGDVTAEDINPKNGPCAFCGIAGKEPYRISIDAFYLDASYSID